MPNPPTTVPAARSQLDAHATTPDPARGTISAGRATEAVVYSVHTPHGPIRITSIGRVGDDLPVGTPVWHGGRPAAEALALEWGGKVVRS